MEPSIHYGVESAQHSSNPEENEEDDDGHKITQTDPSGRFECWDICLGKGKPFFSLEGRTTVLI
jgi:hypothetical protein